MKIPAILGLTFAALIAMPAAANAVLIDIGPSGQRVEPGADSLPSAPAANANNTDYPSTLLTSGVSLAINTLDLSGTKTGNLDWRDRGDGSSDPLVPIGDDFVKNNSGYVRLTLTGVPLGTYDAKTWHIDPDFAQSGAIKIWLDDDGLGFVDTGVTGNANFNVGGTGALTTANVDATSASFQFTSDGANPVIILLDGSAATDTEAPINGIEFTPVPEPSAMILALFGGFAFIARRRR